MSNKNKQNNDFWKRYPHVIERFYKAALSDDSSHSVSEVINFLLDLKVKNENDGRKGTAKMDFIRYTDRVFKGICCLYKVDEFFADYSDEMFEILDCADKYLHDLCDYDTVSNMPRKESGFRAENDLVNYIQWMEYYHLNMYLYGCGNFYKATEKLDRLLTFTKINAGYLLSQKKDALEYAEIDCYGIDGFQLETVYWQPLYWLQQNVAYDWMTFNLDVSDEIRPEVLCAYENYIQFLKEIPLEYYSSFKARNKLIFHAAADLQGMLECAMELIEDEGMIESHTKGYSYDEMERRVKELEELKAAYGEDECTDAENISITKAASRYTEKEWEECWRKAKVNSSEKSNRISYKAWVEPLEFSHVDLGNGTMYVTCQCPDEDLPDHVREHFQTMLDSEVRKQIPYINRVKIIAKEGHEQGIYDASDIHESENSESVSLSRKESLHKEESLIRNEGYYHRTFGPMTKVLRTRMREHPDLPVVILPDGDPSNYNGNIRIDPECVIGYVHDTEGHFIEKAIIICVNKSPAGINDDLFISEDEIPF